MSCSLIFCRMQEHSEIPEHFKCLFSDDVMKNPYEASEETGGRSFEFDRVVTWIKDCIKLFSIIIDEFIILLFLIFFSVYFILFKTELIQSAGVHYDLKT